MKAADLEQVSTAMVEAFTKALELRDSALSKRIAALEARAPIEGPAGKDGRDGIDGKDAEPVNVDAVIETLKAIIPAGAPGINGRDGKDGVDGKDGLPGTDGKDGADGINGKDGAAGADGKDGTPGVDGKNGADGIAGKDGRDGIDGKDGKDGLSIKGDAGKPGIDGKDGRDGIAGADGANGLNGKDGRDGFSLKDFSVEPLEDGRTIRLKFADPSLTVEEELTFPIPIYRDEYTRDRREEIKAYDVLTFGNETWIAKCDTPTSDPGLDPEQWARMARKGRDGRDRDRPRENGPVKF